MASAKVSAKASAKASVKAFVKSSYFYFSFTVLIQALLFEAHQ